VENGQVFHIWNFRETASAAAVGNVDKIGSATSILDLSTERRETDLFASSSKD
jgi:hypothetical protein